MWVHFSGGLPMATDRGERGIFFDLASNSKTAKVSPEPLERIAASTQFLRLASMNLILAEEEEIARSNG